MPHLHRTVLDEKSGKSVIDGGFGQITNEARRSIKQINEVVHGWAIYSYAVTTTWALTGEELGEKLGIHRNAAQAALRHLVKLGWVVRAEWRDGQRNQYGYLFLGHRLEIEVDEDADGQMVRSLTPGSAWNEQVVQELVKAFPRARAVMLLGDRSEGTDLSALTGERSGESAELSALRIRPRSTQDAGATTPVHDAGGKTLPGHSLADARSSRRARATAATESTRKSVAQARVTGDGWSDWPSEHEYWPVFARYRDRLAEIHHPATPRDAATIMGWMHEYAEQYGVEDSLLFVDWLVLSGTCRSPWNPNAILNWVKDDTQEKRRERREAALSK